MIRFLTSEIELRVKNKFKTKRQSKIVSLNY